MTFQQQPSMETRVAVTLHPGRWIMLAVLFVARAVLAIQFETVGSIGPILIDVYKIDFTWLGTLIGLYMLPGILVAIPSGMIAQTFGGKRIALAGLALMVGGGLLTASDTFAVALSGRLISGIGGVVLNVLITKMVADWFADQGLVAAMSIVVASWPLGIGLGLVVFPAAAAASSWMVVMTTAAATACVAFVLMAVFYQESGDAALTRSFRINLTRREWRLIIIAGSIWGFYNASYIIFISFLPDLLTSRGWSLADAGRSVSVLALLPIISVPMSGIFAQKIDRPNMLMSIGLAGTAIAGCFLAFVPDVLALLMCIAILAGLPAGLIMALTSEALAPQNRAVGMGVFLTCFYLCMAILPAVAGRIRDVTADPVAPPLFASLVMAVALGCVVLFRFVQRSADAPATPLA